MKGWSATVEWKNVGKSFFMPTGEQPPRVETDLVVARHDTDEKPGAVAAQHQRLEYALDGFAQLLSDMRGRQMLLVDRIGNQFVADAGTVEQASGIGLFDFHMYAPFFGGKVTPNL